MQFTNIAIGYDADNQIDYYIVQFTRNNQDGSMDGQVRVNADEATLANVLDVARAKMKEYIDN